MCGRYVTPTEPAMERAMDLRGRDIGRELGRIFANYDTRPTQSVPAIRQHGDTREVVRLDDSGDRELVSLRWGLVPRWAKGKAGAYATFNARIETLRTSPAFRDAWKRGQRCLLPVAGFYEWQAQPPDWQKVVQHYITCTDQPEVFAMAGLWDSSTTEDGELHRDHDAGERADARDPQQQAGRQQARATARGGPPHAGDPRGRGPGSMVEGHGRRGLGGAEALPGRADACGRREAVEGGSAAGAAVVHWIRCDASGVIVSM
jgi:putative SOS response-associated peptidase YedK